MGVWGVRLVPPIAIGARVEACQDRDMRYLGSLVLVALALIAPASVRADLSGARADLIAAIESYRAALERLSEFHVAAVNRAAAEVDKRRDLLARGIVSRREFEDSERVLEAARAKLAATRREMVVADHSLSEALIEPPAPTRPAPPGRPLPERERERTTPLLVQYRGFARWSLAEAPKVQEFFARRFGRPLPVSAFGQTPVHDRLGFDHRDAIDVAVTPDSAEGAALMAFLRQSGISFLAFRTAMRGEATGAHIHIGEASPRVLASPR
jgi:hypothetical protein